MRKVECGMEGSVLLLFSVCKRPVVYYCWFVEVRYNRGLNGEWKEVYCCFPFGRDQ